MARIRSIKPTIWTDERFISLSRDARLLCIGMISMADDDGRLLATAVRLAGDIFPADDLRPGQVLRWRNEVERAGLIRIYKVGGIEYAVFPRWKKHQRISKPQPSTLPSEERFHTQSRNESRTHSAPSRGSPPHPPPEPFRDQSDPSRAEAPTSRRQETGEERTPYGGSSPRGSVDHHHPDRYARGREDDDSKIENPNPQLDDRLDGQIAALIHTLTGREISDEHAAQTRHRILGGRTVNDPMAYVAKAIKAEPNAFLPPSTGPETRNVADAIRAARGEK